MVIFAGRPNKEPQKNLKSCTNPAIKTQCQEFSVKALKMKKQNKLNSDWELRLV